MMVARLSNAQIANITFPPALIGHHSVHNSYIRIAEATGYSKKKKDYKKREEISILFATFLYHPPRKLPDY